jgi:hypothetical protein
MMFATSIFLVVSKTGWFIRRRRDFARHVIVPRTTFGNDGTQPSLARIW